jgi:hypothetical protein
MNYEALKTTNRQLSRFLWLVEQESNPPKAEGYLGREITPTTMGHCCLGNGCVALVHPAFREQGYDIEEWMKQSVALPQEVAFVLNITPEGMFNDENIDAVCAFIKETFGKDCIDKPEEDITSLIGVNDGTSLNHEQIGMVIQKCFEMNWFQTYFDFSNEVC